MPKKPLYTGLVMAKVAAVIADAESRILMFLAVAFSWIILFANGKCKSGIQASV